MQAAVLNQQPGALEIEEIRVDDPAPGRRAPTAPACVTAIFTSWSDSGLRYVVVALLCEPAVAPRLV